MPPRVRPDRLELRRPAVPHRTPARPPRRPIRPPAGPAHVAGLPRRRLPRPRGQPDDRVADGLPRPGRRVRGHGTVVNAYVADVTPPAGAPGRTAWSVPPSAWALSPGRPGRASRCGGRAAAVRHGGAPGLHECRARPADPPRVPARRPDHADRLRQPVRGAGRRAAPPGRRPAGRGPLLLRHRPERPAGTLDLPRDVPAGLGHNPHRPGHGRRRLGRRAVLGPGDRPRWCACSATSVRRFSVRA